MATNNNQMDEFGDPIVAPSSSTSTANADEFGDTQPTNPSFQLPSNSDVSALFQTPPSNPPVGGGLDPTIMNGLKQGASDVGGFIKKYAAPIAGVATMAALPETAPWWLSILAPAVTQGGTQAYSNTTQGKPAFNTDTLEQAATGAATGGLSIPLKALGAAMGARTILRGATPEIQDAFSAIQETPNATPLELANRGYKIQDILKAKSLAETLPDASQIAATAQAKAMKAQGALALQALLSEFQKSSLDQALRGGVQNAQKGVANAKDDFSTAQALLNGLK